MPTSQPNRTCVCVRACIARGLGNIIVQKQLRRARRKKLKRKDKGKGKDKDKVENQDVNVEPNDNTSTHADADADAVADGAPLIDVPLTAADADAGATADSVAVPQARTGNVVFAPRDAVSTPPGSPPCSGAHQVPTRRVPV